MRQTLATLVLAALLLMPSACAQYTPLQNAQPVQKPASTAQRPAQPIEALPESEADVPLAPLSDAELLERMSRIYRYQSDILMAQAQGDGERVERLLDLAMTELVRLQPAAGLLDAPEGARYRELYRSVLTEYEKYYEVAPDAMQVEYGDVFALRADMFAALNEDVPLLENVELPRLLPIATTIPMTEHRLVDNSVAYLLRSPERHLYRWIERSATYFPMIEQIFEEEGVPDELKYLAMIESGLNPRANSWAQAGGMWQFIKATGSAYGLETNDYVDERLDPEKATRAAARHLRDLYQQYGEDWHLAIAGYNCSPRCIKRAISAARNRGIEKPTFWDIYDDLPRETRNYVPMFIAAALLASNPDALDQSRITPGPRYEYDVVPVRGTLSLRAIASMAGTSEDVVRALNPELKRATLPPTREHYPLRLPAGTSRTFLAAYETIDRTDLQGEVAYTVRRGDTLSRIAQRYGTSVDALRSRNDLRNNILRAGQQLFIPSGQQGSVVVAAERVQTVQYRERPRRQILAANGAPALRTASNTPPVTPVRTVSDRSRAAPASTTAAETRRSNTSSSSATSTRVVYRVRRGDSLGKIAQRYGTTVGQIRQWNRLSGSNIQAGQRLYLYTNGGEEATASAAPAPQAEAAPTTHRVQRGETLSSIAQRYGVSISDLRSWNGLSGSSIQAGQRLTVRGGSATASRPAVHRVQRGDTLTAIAQRYDVSITDLKRWNNLRSGKIMVGQRLRLNG